MRTYIRVRGRHGDEVTGEVVREQPLTLSVNGEKFLTLLCSPIDLEALVIGYLWMERVIGGLDEVRRVEVSAGDGRGGGTPTHPGAPPPPGLFPPGGGGGNPFPPYPPPL